MSNLATWTSSPSTISTLGNLFPKSTLNAVTAKASPRQASEMLINKASERSQGKGGNCSMAIVKLVKPVLDRP